MKKLLLSCFFAALAAHFQAQVSISPTNTQPHASAMLDVSATNKGMLVPRMTTAQRTAINNPAKGLMVFDNTTNSFWYHNGTAWATVGGADVPSSGIVFSETAVNANLTGAGFALMGKTQMVLTGTGNANNFAWTGETSLTGAPSPRGGHSAVWTGTEMIIWGGIWENGSTPTLYRNGGKFNPITNSWTSTDTINAPTARANQFAIWTGTEMIIWGGSGENIQLLDGEKYNPTSNSWATISSTNAPSWHVGSVIWSGTEMIVWGEHDQIQAVNFGKKYNPTTDVWTDISTTNAPSPRGNHTAIWTGTEMIVWGGAFFNNQPGQQLLISGGKYNPITDTWSATSLSNTPSERYVHGAIWTGTEMIVFGGINDLGASLNSGGKYNPITDSWHDITNSSPTSYPHPNLFWNGAVMIYWYSSDITGIESSSEIYNPESNLWTPLVYIFHFPPKGRTGSSATWVGNSIITWGGRLNSNISYTNQGHILSPAELKPLYLFIKN